MNYRFSSGPIESYSRRNNLKFLNIANQSSVESCEILMLDLFKKFDISLEDHQIERAHRLGGRHQAKSPILVKFLSYKDRQQVFREKARFREHGIQVVEDFPKEVLQHRKMFTPILNAVHKSTSHKAKVISCFLIANYTQFMTSASCLKT